MERRERKKRREFNTRAQGHNVQRRQNQGIEETHRRGCRVRREGGAEERGIQHKGTRAQRTQRSEKIELRFRIGDWSFPALFLLIANYKLRITAPRVGVVRGRGRQKKK